MPKHLKTSKHANEMRLIVTFWKNYAAKGKYVLLTALGHHKWNGYERFTP